MSALHVPAQFDHLCVVLVATRNPLNLGAAARAMSNFGFMHLRVVNPYEIAFREARSAVGASAILKDAEEYKSVADAVSDCAIVIGTTALRNREVHHRFHVLQEGARLIRKNIRSNRIAILFGSEKVGLSNDSLSHCNWLLHIPTREGHPSMNLGQAVAVCLYELAREAPKAAGSERTKLAPAGEVERLTAILLEALHESGYTSERSSSATEAKLRRLLRRFHLDAQDAQLLQGMLRQVSWKLKSKS